MDRRWIDLEQQSQIYGDLPQVEEPSQEQQILQGLAFNFTGTGTSKSKHERKKNCYRDIFRMSKKYGNLGKQIRVLNRIQNKFKLEKPQKQNKNSSCFLNYIIYLVRNLVVNRLEYAKFLKNLIDPNNVNKKKIICKYLKTKISVFASLIESFDFNDDENIKVILKALNQACNQYDINIQDADVQYLNFELQIIRAYGELTEDQRNGIFRRQKRKSHANTQN